MLGAGGSPALLELADEFVHMILYLRMVNNDSLRVLSIYMATELMKQTG